ncbi:hypothetical protein D5S18_24895 [Nocardia panacis]|uniref:Uncharacterized protein n=1 Tax=Nocardia panacis TaxID=2340916 RepID=A0A3A4K1J8_9NOCA|nr:hypothetical protein [Nocardia panacis]RJO71412.1 hypothetical protein D5S18_24895 [Nocardia panacis]
MNTTIHHAAEIAAALGIWANPRIRIEVTDSGWDNACCEETGRPGAVLVEWSTSEEGGYTTTDRCLSGDIAGDYINALQIGDQIDWEDGIDVKIARTYLRFVHPTLADIARQVDTPTQIAA